MSSYAANLSKQTKKALVLIFGKEFVRVHHGRETGFDWIHATVKVPIPFDCNQAFSPGSDCHSRRTCQACRETYDLAYRVCSKATEAIRYSTYCQDDGYGTESQKVIFNIEFA